MLGSDTAVSQVNLGDTADLYAYVFDENEDAVPAASITSVTFSIQTPDNQETTVSGTIQSDGAGFLRYTATTVLGEYIALATFALTSGEVRSTRIDFEVVDPMNPPTPTGAQILTDTVWTMLEDCFDSEEGGPNLRDMTLAYFGKAKIPFFVPFGLLDINIMQPPTELDIGFFTTPAADGSMNTNIPILAYATLMHVIRHLMRAYVEQPTPAGAQVVYEDRRDYLQRWQTILQQMQPEFDRMVILWKRQFLNLGKSALLVHSKAGRLYSQLPGWRVRNVGRGGYF
jgi:hypothetical protein